jgi:hypothetical protein
MGKSDKSDKSNKPSKVARKSSASADEPKQKKARKAVVAKVVADPTNSDDSDHEDAPPVTRDEIESGSESDGARQSDDEDADDGEDGVNEVDEYGKTKEEIEEARKKVARGKARRKGYRFVAKKAGYTASYDSGCAHLDVALPVLSEAEVIRACKWAPKMANQAAYDNINEFEERSQLSLESLPPSAARVIRMHGEAYLRRLTVGAFQRASDQQRTGIKMAQVYAETRPLQRVQKYSFVAPKGMVRFSQNNGNERIGFSAEDQLDKTMEADKLLIQEQKALWPKMVKKMEDEKAEAAQVRQEKRDAASASASIPKKGAAKA